MIRHHVLLSEVPEAMSYAEQGHARGKVIAIVGGDSR